MKKVFYVVLLLAFVACNNSAKEKQATKVAAPEKVVEATINISGMHCDMCVASIEKGVKALDGIKQVKASLNDSNAIVNYDESKVKLAQIEKAIEKRGYSIKK